jgi:hypothetical protein
MVKYTIRFNKSRGQPGRGSMLHVWRVFEGSREILAKHVRIETRSWTELDANGPISAERRAIMKEQIYKDINDLQVKVKLLEEREKFLKGNK